MFLRNYKRFFIFIFYFLTIFLTIHKDGVTEGTMRLSFREMEK